MGVGSAIVAACADLVATKNCLKIGVHSILHRTQLTIGVQRRARSHPRQRRVRHRHLAVKACQILLRLS